MNVLYSSIASVMLILVTVHAAHANIYKTTDKNGVTVFTDNAESVVNDPAASRVEVQALQRYPSHNAPTYTAQPIDLESDFDKRLEKVQAEKQKSQASLVNYQLKMVSPLPKSTYRRGIGNVKVSVAVKPSLNANHVLKLAIDGNEIEANENASYPTSKLIRGEHTASATVVDGDGRTLGSASVNFYVHQTSKIIQDKRKEAERLKEEAKKPWWKRQLNKITTKR